MSYEEILESVTLYANGDQTGNQYLFMTYDASGVAAQTVAGAACVGVLQNKPDDTQAATIGVKGVSKVVSGAAVAAGAIVATDAAAKAVTAVSGDYGQGIALQAATAADEVIAVLLKPQGQLN
jgi:hypothetical protein